MDTIRDCFQKTPQQDNTLYSHGLPYPLSLLCTGPKVDIAIPQDSLSNALCFHSGWVPSSATKCSSHYPTNACPPSVSFTGSDGLPLGLSIEWTRRRRGFAKLLETVGKALDRECERILSEVSIRREGQRRAVAMVSWLPKVTWSAAQARKGWRHEPNKHFYPSIRSMSIFDVSWSAILIRNSESSGLLNQNLSNYRWWIQYPVCR